MEEVKSWLSKLGLSQYEAKFKEEGFDNMTSIGKITEADMEALGVKRGHRVLMLSSERGPHSGGADSKDQNGKGADDGLLDAQLSPRGDAKLVKGVSVSNMASPQSTSRSLTKAVEPVHVPEEKKFTDSTLPRTEIEKGWRDAFAHYTKLMLEGREATYRVGICYLFGMGVVKVDYRKGVELLEQALVNRIRGAASLLAQAHFGGRGVPKNSKEAARLWMMDLEDPHAQLYCAVCVCAKGDPQVIKLFNIALPALSKLADSGDARAQYDLGKSYYYAWGVTKDPTRAAQYYVKAAKQGHAGAQFALGDLYKKGEGVKKDETMAANLIKQSFDQGYEDPTK